MNTDERIHAHYRDFNTDNNDLLSEYKQNLIQKPIMDDDYDVNSQNHINDEIEYISIDLSTSYWNNVFESIRLTNKYWTKIFNIGIDSSPIIYTCQ
jgi:hypothetical protein